MNWLAVKPKREKNDYLVSGLVEKAYLGFSPNGTKLTIMRLREFDLDMSAFLLRHNFFRDVDLYQKVREGESLRKTIEEQKYGCIISPSSGFDWVECQISALRKDV